MATFTTKPRQLTTLTTIHDIFINDKFFASVSNGRTALNIVRWMQTYNIVTYKAWMARPLRERNAFTMATSKIVSKSDFCNL